MLISISSATSATVALIACSPGRSSMEAFAIAASVPAYFAKLGYFAGLSSYSAYCPSLLSAAAIDPGASSTLHCAGPAFSLPPNYAVTSALSPPNHAASSVVLFPSCSAARCASAHHSCS